MVGRCSSALNGFLLAFGWVASHFLWVRCTVYMRRYSISSLRPSSFYRYSGMEGSTEVRIVVRGHTFVVEVDGRGYNISTHSYESIMTSRLSLIQDLYRLWTCLQLLTNQVLRISSYDCSHHHAPLSRQVNTPLSWKCFSL